MLLLTDKKGLMAVNRRPYLNICTSTVITNIPDLKYYQNLVKVTNPHQSIIFKADSPEVKTEFIDALIKCRADLEDLQEEEKCGSVRMKQFLRTDITMNEWQGSACIYTIQIQGARSSWQTFKRFTEFSHLNQYLSSSAPADEIPTFPGKKFLINGTTKKIEYRRLVLDSYLQNIVLNRLLMKSPLVKYFLQLEGMTLNSLFQDSISQKYVKTSVHITNKREVSVRFLTEADASSVCKDIGNQIQLSYVKDFRLFLLKENRIVKVINPNEQPYKVMTNFSHKANRLVKMGVRKVRTRKIDGDWREFLERNDLENNNFHCALLFLKWSFSPYDFSVQGNEETLQSLNLRAHQVVSDVT